MRTYCWYRCRCVHGDNKKENLTQSLFLSAQMWIAVDYYLAEAAGGSMFLQRGTDSTFQPQILPPQPPVNRLTPTPPAGTCGVRHNEFCPSAWPTDLLGPIPQTPPGATQVVKDPASNKLTQCGSFCQKQQDCSAGSDPTADCFCGVPSPQDIRKLGLDPVVPPLVCLVLALSTVGTIGGRDYSKTPYVDEREEPYQCPCNSTYLSNECCGKPDGLLYFGDSPD